MKIEELKNEGLNLEYQISVPAAEIQTKVESDIAEQAKTFKMAGFREGKVPMNIVRKRIGAEVLSRAIENVVDSTLKGLFAEKAIRPALQPYVEIKSFDENSDLVFTAKIEVFPKIPAINWEEIEVETLKVKVGEEDLEKARADIMKNFKSFDKAEEAYAAKQGDAVIIDFVGTVGDEEFEGGKGSGIRLELGSGQFIPGFEEQLIGTKAGDEKQVKVVFPADYGHKKLASQEAVFDVKVSEVLVPQGVKAIDDDFAKKLGIESLEKLNEMIMQKIEADFQSLTRLRTKKLLFDTLDGQYKFPIPNGMLKIDFDAMWSEVKRQMEKNPEQFNKPEDDLKKEYEEIAARRVRLGIILAETAKENNIIIEEKDIQQAVYAEAMQRPGQEKLVIDFYSNPNNLEKLKGPLLEEKAVDFILTKIKSVEKAITSKDFFEKYAHDIHHAA